MDTTLLNILLPINLLLLGAVLLYLSLLSPRLGSTLRHFLRSHFCRKYNYRDLWIKFSEKPCGSLCLSERLRSTAEFMVRAMFVEQLAVWVRPPMSDAFSLAYSQASVSSGQSGEDSFVRLKRRLNRDEMDLVYEVPDSISGEAIERFPIDNHLALQRLGIKRLLLVESDNNPLAILGVGAILCGRQPSAEDNQLLVSLGNQLGQLILMHQLSEELLLAREWASYNRVASFMLHDLKNLATVQTMTLENAQQLGDNPEFVADAFTTFHRTTDKMMNLIANLSAQRGEFSRRQKPVDIPEVITSTVDQLKLRQRRGLQLITSFPSRENVSTIAGDPELLEKAFTNLVLNAIQSLPNGEGTIEITVSHPKNETVSATIKDSGCGMSPEQLKNVFRPFNTTKTHGTGIGLSHTRSIVEVHSGHIRIESQPNAGTTVELEFPILSRSQQKGTTSREGQDSSRGRRREHSEAIVLGAFD